MRDNARFAGKAWLLLGLMWGCADDDAPSGMKAMDAEPADAEAADAAPEQATDAAATGDIRDALPADTNAQDADTETPDATPGGETTDASGEDGPIAPCQEGEPELVLALIPENVTVYRHRTAACDPPPATFLVRNDGPTPVQLSEVGVSSGPFVLEPTALPDPFGVGQRLALGLSISPANPADPGFLDGTLTVRAASGSGCATLSIRGAQVSEPVTTLSAYAVDFGEVASGTASEPREVVVLPQAPGSTPEELSVFSGPSASDADGTEGVFEIVDAPDDETPMYSCEPLTLRVRFNAPQEPGEVEGLLTWEVESMGLSAVVAVPLLATSVAE